MRIRALGTLGTAGLLLTLTLAACGDSGSSGTEAAPSKSGSASAGAQACEAKAGDELVALEDDKQLQTVDNIIPAVNADAAEPPLTWGFVAVSRHCPRHLSHKRLHFLGLGAS